MKVYISGAITGVDNYREIFSAAANKLKDRGCTVYNPADIFDGMPEETTYDHSPHNPVFLQIQSVLRFPTCGGASA